MSFWSLDQYSPAGRRAALLDAGACVIAVGLAVLVAVNFVTPLRLLLALLFTFFVPGRAVVSNWPRVARWSGIGMSMALSLGILTLLATVTLWAGWWHPGALFLIVAIASLAGLANGIVHRHRVESAVDVELIVTDELDTATLVTVITPAFNVAKYIGEAVDSVRWQTFMDFEYIIIDDGSTDNTAEIARVHAGDDPRIRVIQAPHRGLSATRNLGIEEARGSYIAFLDGDDRWRPRFLERQLELMDSLPDEVGVVFCRSRLMLENGTLAGVQWQRSGRYEFDDFLVKNNPARNGSSLLIRKSCFRDVGVFDDARFPVEDLEMWLRIADGSKTPALWGSRHFLVDLRLRPGSVTRDRSAVYNATRSLLEEQTPKLRHAPPGLAYVHPAVAALKYGDADEALAEELAAEARTAGVGRLLRSSMGWRLLFWSALPLSGRSGLRKLQHGSREAVKATSRRLRG